MFPQSKTLKISLHVVHFIFYTQWYRAVYDGKQQETDKWINMGESSQFYNQMYNYIFQKVFAVQLLLVNSVFLKAKSCDSYRSDI